MKHLSVGWPDAAALARSLEPLQAIAVAVFDNEGRVLDGNRGFRRLVGADGDVSDVDVSAFLALPTFGTLRNAEAADGDDTVHRGRITLNRPGGQGTSIRGVVRRQGGVYLLIAEHEIEELEGMASSLIDLNERMATTQRELVRAKKMLEARERELATLAITDPLTGLANRRELDRRLEEEGLRSERVGLPLSVMMVDLDHFKEYNDTHGHHAGDRCLETIAKILADSTRPYDVVARYGGEEFVVVLPGTTREEAMSRAEEMREAIERVDLPGTKHRITASFGVANTTRCEPGDLLQAADAALYEAKRAGRNRVHAAGG